MAFDSLVIADRFELLGGSPGVQSDIPELMNAAGVGAIFRLYQPQLSSQGVFTNEAWSLGEPQPDVDITETLMLDGERPFGLRASNRTITLPLRITAPDQVTLTAARELLMQAVDAQTFTMTYTPASTGLSTVFDCFRALPADYAYGFMQNQPMPICNLTLTFQALPYGRSDPSSLTTVAFASPLLGVSAPPAPVVLDNYATVSGANWSQSASQFVVGPKTARWMPPDITPPYHAAVYSATISSKNITGLTALSVWLGLSFDTNHYAQKWAPARDNITLRWTLTDNTGHTLSFSKAFPNMPQSNVAWIPKWTRVTVPIPQGNAAFNYASVIAYSARITNWAGSGTTSLVRANAWLDALTANPPSLAIPASQRGVVYNIMGTGGTARTPVSTQFQLPQAGPVSQELSGTGLWWPPVGVTSVQAECVGGGGSGGSRTTSGFGGGGGGGEYAAEAALTVLAGTPVPYACGAPGNPGSAQQVLVFNQPGKGNWTCPAGVTTVKCECWGGGGQGAAGGGGGGGAEYGAEPALAVTPGKTYSFTVGAGGYNTLVGYGPAGNGGTSAFVGDSVQVSAQGGSMPRSGGTVGGAGGNVSTNTTHFHGGAGGTSPSYGGGGGGGSGGSAAVGNAGGNASGNTGGTGAAAVTNGGAGGTGAFNPGFPLQGSVPGGGGGGGYGAAGNNAGAAGGAGQIQLTYTVAAGSAVNGGNTTFGSAATTGTVVTAHGGASVALNSAAGAAGGSGSGNTAHFSGGAGSTVTSVAGGGGGSGGSASAGNAAGANTATGAAAVTGGGKGANGGSTSPDNGDSASPPGGGGGGAATTGTIEPGGAGGAGNIVVTWTPPLAPFSTLVAHRPSLGAPPSLNPCVPINNTADIPAGTQYTVPSLVPGVSAIFDGTYTIVLVNYNWDSPTVQRTITVTVNQFEYTGGPAYPLSVTRIITPSTDIVNGICIMGELTLPVKLIDSSNTSAYFTVSVIDTDVADQFLDVLFLDTQGSSVIVNIPPGNSYVNMFIDEPTADRDLGLVLGSDLDRSQAISVMDASIISGSPFYIQPGDNTFLAYTTAGAPNLGVSYLNRWYLERLT